MATVVKYNAKKRTYTGTNENDVLDASILGYEPIGKTNIKKNRGLTITGGNGDDKITGTDYNDTIKGGNGNDTITGEFGVDTITGGAGVNIINYAKGDGNDIINLTKGENFTLNFTDLSKNHLRFEFVNKNKDLRIYTSKTSDDEYITIKNFVKKDVTNNSNTKKKLSDTSSVELMFNNVLSSRIDLRTVTNLYKTKISKNYTGTWLSEEIDAKDYQLYKTVKVGKTKVKEENNNVSSKGLTIKGGAGKDVIMGSKYSDKIYGNTGDDRINAGTGNNYIYFNKGDGNDIIENGGGVDTLVFVKGTKITYELSDNDLIVKYNNNSVTLKSYYSSEHSVKYIKIGNKKEEFNPPQKQVIHEFNSNDYLEYIYPNAFQDILYFNQQVRPGTYDPHYFIRDIIYSWSANKKDLILYYNGTKSKITIKNYDLNNNSVYIAYGSKGEYTLLLSDLIKTDFKKFDPYGGRIYFDSVPDTKILNIKDTNSNLYVYFEDGNNNIINNGTFYTLNISGGNDTVTNNGNITRIKCSGKGNNIINTIDAEIGDITCSEGDDYIINEKGATASYIDCNGGNDTVTNNGSAMVINGGNGNDKITNNGTIKDISGGEGDDIITTGVNSSADYIYFANNTGNDTLYLNAAVNNIHFAKNTGIKTYTWSGDDLIISYNNSDNVIIKNYNPNNASVIVNVGTGYNDYSGEYVINYTNLATLVPEKPVTSMMMSASNMNINEISEQVASFTSTDSDMSLNYNDLQNMSDTSSLIAEYTPEQPQIM